MKNPVNDQKPTGEIKRHPRFPQLVIPRNLADRLMRGGEFDTSTGYDEYGDTLPISNAMGRTRPNNKYRDGLGFRLARTKRK